jgi:hypothetical protein
MGKRELLFASDEGFALRRPQHGLDLMRGELRQALMEALCEIELLPASADGAMLGLYAVMDDLRDAMERTQAFDPRGPG